MPLTSPSLLHRLRNQTDDIAWSRLCNVYEPMLWHWLRGLEVPPTDRDDLIQNVLLIVCQKFPEFEHNGRPGAFRTWLRTIVAFQSREFLRKRRGGVGQGGDGSDPILDGLTDSSSELSQQWDREHDQFVIRKMLDQIKGDFSPRVWEAFCAIMLEGLSPQEVAMRSGATLQAVYASKARVMARLREELHGWVEY